MQDDGGERAAPQLFGPERAVGRTLALEVATLLERRIDPSVEPLLEEVRLVRAEPPAGLGGADEQPETSS